ncbi:RNA polymerase sigma factor [Candidatus Falkowbacteria bacterium]|nr:RNA polymerase sigma factor [Candidatus Falkowbacteria bacterium]
MKRASLKEKFLIFKVKQNKDAEAYGMLYDYYVERIFRFIFFKVSSSEIAEDLTSEVFLKTWEYINRTTEKIGNFNALLYRVARNAVIDHYRSKGRTIVNITDEELFEQIADKRDLEKEADTQLEIENVRNHLKKLKDIYQEVITLKYIEEFSIAEIAEIMEKKKGAVRVLLHRALKALKEIAGEE